ncbi:tripartite tricarboxylate transporter substrate binding protein [Roseicella sp. DB1501]|uniref:Bug family tripartite tricarboxylate transporter substrate binding protein n=1 Tax=Roseicella sp. DB1501 TaxID=2730925 RepID=UPI001490F0F1|nr:tripartite tricarboxylate transporter substrate binding protein [Roseicella sp. DB1501]NOG71813.1 tripartite tricarboxylate transporter substrate binding protein [Roseicella sp. DB1501]
MRARRLLLLGLLVLPVAARAEEPAARPPRLMAGFAAGGTLDILARLMAEGMTPLLGQRVIVENRPGANGMIAAEAVARGAADGTTLLVCPTGSMTISPQLPDLTLPIDPVQDLVPVANMITTQHAMVVAAKAPWRSVAELVDAARAQPGTVSYATAGAGSGQQLSGAWLARLTGTEMVPVPYRGMAPAMPDIIAGRTGFAITNIGDVAGQLASGDLRLLAVASAGDSPLFPGAPFLGDLVPGMEVSTWIGLCGPRGVPAPVVARWSAAVRQALESPAIRSRLLESGMIPRYEDAAAFARTMAADRAKWGSVIREAKIRAD